MKTYTYRHTDPTPLHEECDEILKFTEEQLRNDMKKGIEYYVCPLCKAEILLMALSCKLKD